MPSSALITSLTLAGEPVSLLDEQTVGILVAKCLFTFIYSAPIGTLINRAGTLCLGGGVRWALIAVSLLGFVLVEPTGAEHALIQG